MTLQQLKDYVDERVRTFYALYHEEYEAYDQGALFAFQEIQRKLKMVQEK